MGVELALLLFKRAVPLRVYVVSAAEHNNDIGGVGTACCCPGHMDMAMLFLFLVFGNLFDMVCLDFFYG